MILVDTNVWSEQLKTVQEKRVLDWTDANGGQLYMSSIVLAELRFFVAKQDEGRRKKTMADLLAAIAAATSERFVGFGEAEATAYGDLMARMRQAGTPLPLIDGWISAQSIANGLSVATRNVQHFEPAGMTVINPWEA